MVGVKGAGGPPPKRSDQRRRSNPPAAGEPTKAPKGSVTPASAQRPDPKWHPVAKRWFSSLARSGQSRFYEPSDWATAWVVAESISRELMPRPVALGVGEDGVQVVVYHEFAPRGAALAAWLKGMTSLMATEGDRRRAALELGGAAPPPAAGEGGADVSWIDDARRRAARGGAG